MTSTLTPPTTDRPAVSRRVIIEAGLFEASRMLRHPLLWVGALGSLWMIWLFVGDTVPILERDSVYLTGAMLPLAAATLLVANYSILRQRQIVEVQSALPRRSDIPTLGVQLGLVAPVGIAALLQLAGLSYLYVGDPIGSIAWLELIAGPVMVAVLGLGGVVLARRLPHPIVAPVVLVALSLIQLLSSPDAQLFSPTGPTPSIEWLAPWLTPSAFEELELVTSRPAGLHLVYLMLLGVVTGLLAHKSSRMSTTLALASTIALAGLVVGVTVTLPSEPTPESGFDWRTAAANPTCENNDNAEYCSFAFYEEWIPRWQETVASVSAILPVQLEMVIQRPLHTRWEPDDVEHRGWVLTSTEWDREGGLPNHAFDLAQRAAQSAVGLPTMATTRPYTEGEIESILAQNPDHPEDLAVVLRRESSFPKACSAIGQARAVVAVWAAAATLERGDQALTRALEDAPSPTFRISRNQLHEPAVTIGTGDAELAFMLTRQPTDHVVQTLTANWSQVLDPSTTSSDLASWFGISYPRTVEPNWVQPPCP